MTRGGAVHAGTVAAMESPLEPTDKPGAGEALGAAARVHFDVAVVLRLERLNHRWQPWRWSLEEVVPQQTGFGTQPRPLVQDEHGARWLYPGLRVTLYRDDAEGYHLNLASPAPCWFVHWRQDEDDGSGNPPKAWPEAVSLSYHEAGRWLDAQERVDQLPVPGDVLEVLQAFTQEHYAPEPRRRKRPDSFRPLQDRFGNPASVSTDKPQGRGGAHG